jgi:hypothetical protein
MVTGCNALISPGYCDKYFSIKAFGSTEIILFHFVFDKSTWSSLLVPPGNKFDCVLDEEEGSLIACEQDHKFFNSLKVKPPSLYRGGKSEES